MKVVCPNCQQPYDIADADIGKQFRCTKCQQTFVASTTQTSGSVTERAEQRVNDAISRLEGIDCHGRGTSCPDQMAKALRQMGNQ